MYTLHSLRKSLRLKRTPLCLENLVVFVEGTRRRGGEVTVFDGGEGGGRGLLGLSYSFRQKKWDARSPVYVRSLNTLKRDSTVHEGFL